MPVRYLTDEEKEMIFVALSIRRNIVETGSPTLGASDLEKMEDKKHAERQYGAKIRALSDDQMRLLLASRELERKLFSDKLFIEEERG